MALSSATTSSGVDRGNVKPGAMFEEADRVTRPLCIAVCSVRAARTRRLKYSVFAKDFAQPAHWHAVHLLVLDPAVDVLGVAAVLWRVLDVDLPKGVGLGQPATRSSRSRPSVFELGEPVQTHQFSKYRSFTPSQKNM